MTFYEAALEVLRTAQRPLDYKTITQFAINRQLLGHVGHTPDVVMASCLIRAVQRSDAGGALIWLPSGEFALRGWPENILALASEHSIPTSVANIDFPPQNVGLLDNTPAVALLQNDDVQFSRSAQTKFEQLLEEDQPAAVADFPDASTNKFEQVKNDLTASHNEHYNLSAAIVKTLRDTPAPMRASLIAFNISQKFDSPVYEHSVVLAMRADNALRVSRGKRAVFMHIPPDLWTLTENFLARHILKLESKIYDMSRQLRSYSLQAVSAKLRELSPHAWNQLSSIILKHLNYTIISQCQEVNSENSFIFRAEESKGLSYIPVIIKVLHTKLVDTEDIIQFRDLIIELGYENGVLMVNGDVSKDALNECITKDVSIYAYSPKQIAPIMLDAKIGVIPNELPIVFIDNNFFQALSESNNGKDNDQDNNDISGVTDTPEPPLEDFDADEPTSGEYLFDDGIDRIVNE